MRAEPSMRSRAFSLVEILVVLVILMVLAAFLLPNYLGGAKDAKGRKVEAPIQRAHSVECKNNLSQIRQAYTMATTTDENRPQSVADLRTYGVSDSISKCPVGKEPYRLEPQSGRVGCVHPGHEQY
jgi:competence protein ComGC